MKFYIITAFPNSFSPLFESIVKRAQEKNLIELKIIDLKNFGLGKWKKIDDKPFGGGAGMLLQIEPIYNALKSIGYYPKKPQKSKVILVSARGTNWNQNLAKKFKTDLKEVVIICGHYEGVDQRVIDNMVDEEISIGNYILSGGELASMVIVDSITRLIDGTLGNSESAETETQFNEDGTKVSEYPQYTRPEVFLTDEGEEWKTPEVLLSGNHTEIEKWKEKNTVVNNGLGF